MNEFYFIEEDADNQHRFTGVKMQPKEGKSYSYEPSDEDRILDVEPFFDIRIEKGDEVRAYLYNGAAG